MESCKNTPKTEMPDAGLGLSFAHLGSKWQTFEDMVSTEKSYVITDVLLKGILGPIPSCLSVFASEVLMGKLSSSTLLLFL